MTALRNSRGQFAVPRTPPPPLEYRSPDCPMCDKEVGHDGDGFVCEGCDASWPSDRYDVEGEWGGWGEIEIACPSAIKPYDRVDLEPKNETIRHIVEKCILADDHGGKHRAINSWYKWDDDDPRTVVAKAVASLQP